MSLQLPMVSLRGELRGSLRPLRMVLAARFEHTCTRRSDNEDASASVFKNENASTAYLAVDGSETMLLNESR